MVPLLSAPRHTAQGRVVARAVILAHLAMSCVPPNVLASHAHAGALAAVLAFEAAETLAFMEEHAAARDLLGTGGREEGRGRDEGSGIEKGRGNKERC